MTVALHHGDCREVVRTIPDCSIDSCVTDPPYSLVSIQKRFGKPGSAPAQEGNDGLYRRASAGFMGQQWDTGEVAHDPAFWRDVLRVMKPGAHLVAFAGTRTYHRLACAIEDAGFEIRDQLAWAFGSGFPKSHAAGKAVDKALGAVRAVRASPNGFGGASGIYHGMAETANVTEPATEQGARWEGWGTALKPAWEPIVLARKPLVGTIAENLLQHACGAINIDRCRIEYASADDAAAAAAAQRSGRDRPGRGRWGEEDGTKFQDPLGSLATWHAKANLGRWPANLLHDNSDEVLALFDRFGERKVGAGTVIRQSGKDCRGNASSVYGAESRPAGTPTPNYGDTGSAARFFFSAKADSEDRWGSRHPTVKPVALMRWLGRLVTPVGGTILEPFAGSGTTGVAAIAERFNVILIEREDQYIADIRERLAFYEGGGMHSAAAKNRSRKRDEGPLFEMREAAE